MLLGVIADDFTGASDIANNIARGLGDDGLRAVQYLGVPRTAAGSWVEAGVVALKSRSIEAEEAVRQSLAALDWLLEQGCRQIVFKYASTFDSTPAGNIGPVAQAIARRLGMKGVAMCPAFPAMGRTVYQGHLFVADRLLNESGLENHPLNPMTDANLRRWLSRQTGDAVGLVRLQTVRQGAAAIRAELWAAVEELVIVDTANDSDLVEIGRALADAPFLTGGSGIGIALPANFAGARTADHQVARVDGPEAILVGSCSGATRQQVEHHAAQHPTLAISVDAVMAGETTSDILAEFLLEHTGDEPLVYSSATPEQVRQTQSRHGRELVATTLDRLFADTARSVVQRGVRRIVVGGGETSGAVVSALGLDVLTIGDEIDPGVPVLVSESSGIGLALKSGNFGSQDFFSKALTRIGGA